MIYNLPHILSLIGLGVVMVGCPWMEQEHTYR